MQLLHAASPSLLQSRDSERSQPQRAGQAIPWEAARMFSESEPSGAITAGTESSAAAAAEPEKQEVRREAHESQQTQMNPDPAPGNGVHAAPENKHEKEASSISTPVPNDVPAAGESEPRSAEHPSPSSPDPLAGDAFADAPRNAESAEAADETSTEELNQLIDQYAAPQQASTEGEIVEGRVIAVADLGIVVDIGGKSEGLIPSLEFAEADQPVKLLPGQTIEVQLTGEHKEGYVVLSYQRARRRRVWADLEKAYHDKTSVTGRIVDRVKGGLVVDVGVRAFLPASQADLRPVHDLEEWTDRELEVRVLKLNRKRGNVVVSRRAILDQEQNAQRQKLVDSLAEGQIFHGTVKSITSYGVFVDLGGLDGLLHVSDLSWGRVGNPADVVRPGEELDVQVLKFDREKLRVSLGRRQLLPDPWATVPERFAVGARVQGRIVGVADYGCFVELADGVEGLVHVSEMSWSKRKQHPSKLVQVGDAVEVVVLEVRPDPVSYTHLTLPTIYSV